MSGWRIKRCTIRDDTSAPAKKIGLRAYSEQFEKTVRTCNASQQTAEPLEFRRKCGGSCISFFVKLEKDHDERLRALEALRKRRHMIRPKLYRALQKAL
ncbi:hypothetical protein ANCCAN_30098 [Ancylostoma caninum]|uniref:Uncharacterized protein n=1 Tax=Ancylostoma caninum TaxID=29170 RepID=A0A368EWT2_ANCCA|nr:hypothetical protein ANCCAN_30098 [Ancylostoma caninum]